MSYTVPFSQLTKAHIPAAGGKGANLGELTTAGLPVPAGFVLTTGAYDAFVQAHGVPRQIVDLAHTVSADDPQSSAAASEQIRALFMQGVIADDVAAEITTAYAQLTRTQGHAVAVRSSATAEDLPTASFAGQQDTYLNVQGEEALLAAVKKCWASLWTARAISYRLRQKIDPATVSLAVVVQQFVPADAAGVLFTANPVNGQRDQILINATWGLGEAIVSGQVTPDTVVVEKSTGTILSREIATKTLMTVRTDTGTEERDVPQAQRDQQVLDDATTAQLARYGAQIEAHYDTPMDIEWAIADGEIAIVQARPITTLPDPKPAPLTDVRWEPAVPKTVWMRRQIVEHMPEPLSPLFEDLYLRRGMGTTLREMLDTMGRLDLDALMPQGFAATINGYAYTTGSFKMNGSTLMAILRVYTRIFHFLKNACVSIGMGSSCPDTRPSSRGGGPSTWPRPRMTSCCWGFREMAQADSGYWFGSAVHLGFSRLMDSLFRPATEVLPVQVCVAEATPRQRVVPAWIRLEGAGRPGGHGSARQYDPRVGAAARVDPRDIVTRADGGIGRASRRSTRGRRLPALPGGIRPSDLQPRFRRSHAE